MAVVETINKGDNTYTKTTKKTGFDGVAGVAGSGLSLANGIAGLLDGIFGFSAKRQQNMQKQLMNLQQDQWKEQQDILNMRQLEQWNRENEYNDPTNYFKRLMNGADVNGLSKAAVLGNMPGGSVGTSAQGVTAPGSTSPGSAGSPTLLPVGSANTLSNLRQRAEIANIEADTEQKRKNAGLLDAKTTTEQVGWSLQNTMDQYYRLMGKDAEAGAALKKIQAKFVEVDLNTLDLRNQATYDKTVNEISKLYAETIESILRSSKTDLEKQQIMSEIRYNMSMVALNFAYKRESAIRAAQGDFNLSHLDEIYSMQVRQLNQDYENSVKQGVLYDKESQGYHWYKGLNTFANILQGASGVLTSGVSFMRFMPKTMPKIGF